MANIIPNIRCPRCQSSKLYRFGKDISGKQRYRCRDCLRQFSYPPGDRKKLTESKYPRCPRCGKASFLHHDYKHYFNYRCGDKKCNHSFFLPKLNTVDETSSSLLASVLPIKGLRFPLHVVFFALSMYFIGKVSLRKTSFLLELHSNIKVSHVSIAHWCKLFAPVFQSISSCLASKMDFASSDEWHLDETVVKINGNNYYLWLAIDSETRFILDFHLSPHRSSDQAFALLNSLTRFGQPRAIVSDRYAPYKVPVKAFFPNSKHIRVASFKDDISNNLLEAFNGQFKAWYKGRRGFCSFESANSLIAVLVFAYNFLMPHSSLSNLAPAQVAGCSYSKLHIAAWLTSLRNT